MELTERSREVLEGARILMKAAKEQKKIEKKGKKAENDRAGETDHNLFGKLRSLRLEIARKEKIPPYLVFSDKTLIHMCQIHPKTREEMLRVSGVGEVKYRRYGEAFLEVLKSSR